jgi:hypothetical protein
MKCGILAEDAITARYDITKYQLAVLLFVYDLQFFYLPYIAEMLMSQGVRRTSYMEKFVEPLLEKEYLQVVDRGSDDERHFFKENFRNRRFMITARARQLVQDRASTRSMGWLRSLLSRSPVLPKCLHKLQAAFLVRLYPRLCPDAAVVICWVLTGVSPVLGVNTIVVLSGSYLLVVGFALLSCSYIPH